MLNYHQISELESRKKSIIIRRSKIFDSFFYKCFGFGKHEIRETNTELDKIYKYTSIDNDES